MDPDQQSFTPEQSQPISPVGQPMPPQSIGEQTVIQQQVSPIGSAAQQQPVPPVGGSTLPQSPMPESKQSSSLWNKMLLFLLAFIILVGVAAGSYYLGVQRGSTSLPTVATKVAVPTAVPSVMPITSSASAQIVQAGGVLNLKAYTASVPAGWVVKHTVKSNSDQVMIAKDGYTINIWEVAGDGGACSYPDHKITTGIIHGDYTSFVQFADQDGMVYRRGFDTARSNSTGLYYTVCNLHQGYYSNFTPFGTIFYNTPNNPTEAMLTQMDEIVSTLKAQ